VPPVITEDAIDAVLSKPVYVTKNGKSVKMSRHMAVLEKLVATALAGNMRAMTLVIAQLNKKEKASAHDTAEDLSEADEAILDRLVARRTRAAASEGGDDE
jgi:GTP cyclohydrolase FolE2